MKKVLSDTDINILKLLQRNGRESFQKIANQLNVSDATIHNRIKKMLESGIIKGFYVDVNESSLGFDILVCMGFNVNTSDIESVTKHLIEISNLYEIWTTTGTHNITARGIFKDHAEIQEFTKRIHSIKGITSFDFGIVVEENKTLKRMDLDEFF